jgi:hypothetical protein
VRVGVCAEECIMACAWCRYLRVAGDAREQILGDGGSTHSSVHDTVQQTVAAQPVAPVHSCRTFSEHSVDIQ